MRILLSKMGRSAWLSALCAAALLAGCTVHLNDGRSKSAPPPPPPPRKEGVQPATAPPPAPAPAPAGDQTPSNEQTKKKERPTFSLVTGQLEVIIQGGSCAVTVDGTPLGVLKDEEIEMLLKPGDYEVTCTPEGKPEQAQMARIAQNKLTQVVFELGATDTSP